MGNLTGRVKGHRVVGGSDLVEQKGAFTRSHRNVGRTIVTLVDWPSFLLNRGDCSLPHLLNVLRLARFVRGHPSNLAHLPSSLIIRRRTKEQADNRHRGAIRSDNPCDPTATLRAGGGENYEKRGGRQKGISHKLCRFTPNDHHQRCEPAAADVRIVTDVNGWLASAAWFGSVSLCGPGEENAPQVLRQFPTVEIAPSIQIRLERFMALGRHTILYRLGRATTCKPKPLRTFRE
jgi:hypothetical protein